MLIYSFYFQLMHTASTRYHLLVTISSQRTCWPDKGFKEECQTLGDSFAYLSHLIYFLSHWCGSYVLWYVSTNSWGYYWINILIFFQLNGEYIIKALSEQVVHYSITSSLFDIVLLAGARFILLIIFYAFLSINHWIVISVSLF